MASSLGHPSLKSRYWRDCKCLQSIGSLDDVATSARATAIEPDSNRFGCLPINDPVDMIIPSSWIALVEDGHCSLKRKVDLITGVNAAALIIGTTAAGPNYIPHADDEITSYEIPICFVDMETYTTLVLQSSHSFQFQIAAAISFIYQAITAIIMYLIPLIITEIHQFLTITFLSLNILVFILCISPFIIAVLSHHYSSERPHKSAAIEVVEGLQVRFSEPNLEGSSCDDRQTCSICLEPYWEGDVIRILPCRHEFHIRCVDKWLMDIVETCPLCKRSIFVVPEVKRAFSDSSHESDRVYDLSGSEDEFDDDTSVVPNTF
ncbi:hypothetical protein BDR26DRAFT_978513 [Obelidium mucronatum]|nr:hypothetical protein BDR26DRAFT_978513 [Obelidium mucronatum]